MTGEHWRLLIDPVRDGAANMAIDEAILKSVGAGHVPPTLRLYRWQTPCLSLGYAQRATDADREAITARGWEIVRRLTGGLAILHTDEITYSVTLPANHPLTAGTIVDSYRRISAALLAALQQLGSDPHADAQAQKPQHRSPVCFEVPSDYEITVNGKKLIGSAQRRYHSGTLQHGSLPLEGDLSRICEALAFPSESDRQIARLRVLERATTLAEAVGYTIGWDEVAGALTQAFAVTFDLEFEDSGLTDAERRAADDLYQSRYAADSWTFRF